MSETVSDIDRVGEVAQAILGSVGSVFKGKKETLEHLLVTLFAGGHVLIEDVPGTGKTVLAKALAKSVDLPFSRVQCTPDLMPADVTGTSVFSPKTQKFRFRKGPIHASVVLVDELNRATPRTQSAFLEAMAEAQVSADGRLYPLPSPFFLIATENPIESEGTFPLPEAQKDRFMLALSPGYPSAAEEADIIEAQRRKDHPVNDVRAAASAEDVLACQGAVVSVHVESSVRDYLLALTAATREDSRVAVGVSPRGSIALYKAVQALAAIRGRTYATPEDVKELLVPAFRKRLILKGDYLARGYRSESILAEIAVSVPVPAFKDR